MTDGRPQGKSPDNGTGGDGSPSAGALTLATVLFADVVASTSRIAMLEPEDARDLLDDALARMRLRIRQFGGTLARVQGDGVMAVFGAPVPLEDHALRACCAAAAMCEDFRGLASASPAQPQIRSIRVGVHSGKFLVRLQRNDYGVDYDAVGPDVHIAAKAEAKAPPNTALITEETLLLAGPPVAGAAPMGALQITSDVELPLFALGDVALDHGFDRLFPANATTPLVGRRSEIELLTKRLAELAAGKGTSLSIIGEAGIGKSRLTFEFSRRAQAKGIRVEVIRGVSVQSFTPFAALKPFIASLLGCAAGDGTQVAATLEALAMPEELRPGILEVLDLKVGDERWNQAEAPARRRIIVQAVSWLTDLRARRPLLIIAEDVHHIDTETADLLPHIVELTKARPLTLVATARHVVRDRAMSLTAEAIDLAPLSVAEMDELSRLLSPQVPLGSLERTQIAARAGGNPLFLQEIVRALAVRGANFLTDWQAPVSVATLVQARMVLLSATARDLVQAASILGDTDQAVLAATAGVAVEDLPAALGQIGNQDLIDLLAEGTIRFRHELFRSGVRMGLLRPEASRLHARAAHALETVAPQTPETTERIAYHCEKSGQIDKALTYLLRACRHSVRNSSLKTVRSMYDRAKALRTQASPASDGVILEIATASLDALQQSGDVAELRIALDFVIERSKAVGDRAKESFARALMSVLDWLQAKHAQGIVHAETALRLANELDNVTLRTTAGPAVAYLEHALGNLDRAIALQLDAIRELEGGHEHSTMGRMILPSVRSRAFAAWIMTERGRFADAWEQIEKAERALAAIDQPYSRTLLDTSRGILLNWSKRSAEAIAPLQRARDMCHEHKFYLMEASASAQLALALVRTGQPDRGKSIVLSSIESKRYLAAGRNTWMAVFQALAEAHFALGEKEAAFASIDKAIAVSEEAHEPLQIAQARFVRGWMLAACNEEEAAAEDFHWALATATKLHMDPLAANCHSELALLASRRRRGETLELHRSAGALLFRKLGLPTFADGLAALT